MAPTSIVELDVCIVGTGWAGVNTLQRFRNAGFKVRAFERGSDIGGVWYWNQYPGIRVDSEVPIYQYTDKELYKDFAFNERFPAGPEILRYFAHVEKKWNVKKDMEFNVEVTSASFDDANTKWIITLDDGREVHSKWFIPCTGFASKFHIPKIPGLETFKGTWFHSARWPSEKQDFTGKRVLLIGTGATGVQLVQEIAPVADKLTVFVRTPPLATPMVQKSNTDEEVQQAKDSGEYDRIFEKDLNHFGGFTFTFVDKSTFDDTPEQRKAFYEDLYAKGGFNFWLGTYKDMLYTAKSNNEAYSFWKEKTREQIRDPAKQKLLAPDVAPHPIGTKRVPLYQTFYAACDRDTVELVDLTPASGASIERITEKGIIAGGKEYEGDVIVFATGFDTNTGEMARMNITGIDGANLSTAWTKGDISSYLGMAAKGFPNMLWMYGTQSPAAFSNGPTLVQVQSKWIVAVAEYCRANNISRFETTDERQDYWVKTLNEAWNISLFPLAKSWYQGANIPGKKVQPLVYAGGLPLYVPMLEEEAGEDYPGFVKTV